MQQTENRAFAAALERMPAVKVGKWTKQDLLTLFMGQTSIVKRGPSRYRHWPIGIGLSTKGHFLRPKLTTDQKSLMSPNDILAYQDGRAADVPLIDDPVEK